MSDDCRFSDPNIKTLYRYPRGKVLIKYVLTNITNDIVGYDFFSKILNSDTI